MIHGTRAKSTLMTLKDTLCSLSTVKVKRTQPWGFCRAHLRCQATSMAEEVAFSGIYGGILPLRHIPFLSYAVEPARVFRAYTCQHPAKWAKEGSDQAGSTKSSAIL